VSKIIEPVFKYNFPLPKGYLAITLGKYICFSCSREELDKRWDKEPKILHELVHFEQIQSDGILKFYTKYILFYLLGLVLYRNHMEAYMNIPYEVEAYRAERDYVNL
jgi:hypothetical protein